MSRHQGSYEHFEALRQRARDEVERGDLQAALTECDRAIAWAQEFGDRDARDLAHCNRSSILVTQGGGEGVITRLRQILLSSSKPEICYQAANNISRFHEMRNEHDRGTFYAQLSLDHAERSGQPVAIARSHNQLGLLLLRQSYFEEAAERFDQALGVLALAPGYDRAVLLCNLGYCQIMIGRQNPGFSNLFTSLRMARRQGVDIAEMFPHLSLSFAYLEIDRPARAVVHARRGLELAEEAGMTWQVKNALYLLGESEKLAGNELEAHRQFTRLQQEFYPDDPVIPDFLMVTDVRKLINLMA